MCSRRPAPAISPAAPTRSSYDAVVVGAGLGGLVAAAYLAKFGVSTLLVDRLDGAGGLAHSFQRGPYTIDPAVHVIPQAGDGETIDELLRFLGVRDRCTFHLVPTLYRTLVEDTAFDAPPGMEAFTDALCETFPADADGARAFLALCDRYVEEAKQMPIQLRAAELDAAVERFPTVFTYRTATVASVLDAHVADPRCRAAIVSIWGYLGLPPSRLAFEIFARFLVTLVSGAYHAAGGFQSVADAFLAAFESRGGEFLAGTEVTRIRVDDGRVVGVTLAGGGEVDAPIVISNADARRTIHDLVGKEHLPSPYLRRLERLRTAASMFVVYAATARAIERDTTPFQTVVFRDGDLDRAYASMMNGRPEDGHVVIPTLTDETLAPSGEHLVFSMCLAPYALQKPWAEEKTKVEEHALGLLDRALPGLRNELTFVESATPLAIERYTLNTDGSATGWENAPDQSASRRLSYVTPLQGLYLVGHWTQAGSALRVMVSGTHTAQIVLRGAGVDDVGPHF